MKRKCFFLFCLVLVFMSAKQDVCYAKRVNNKIISVDVKSIENHNLSDISESIRLIPLMTSNKDVQIPDISYAYMNEKILLLKSSCSQNYFLFDTEGNYLADFCQIMGHDKLRFNNYDRICTLSHHSSIDNKNDIIYLSDGSGRVCSFSYSGKLLDTMNVPISDFSDMMKLKKGFVYMSGNMPYYVSDGSSKKKDSNLLSAFQGGNKTLKMNKPVNLYPFTGLYTSDLNKEYLFHTYANDTLFSICRKNGSINTKFIIDFGVNSFPNKLSDMPYNQYTQYLRDNMNCAGYVRDVFANEQYVSFNYIYQGNTEDFIYNVKTGNVLNGTIKNDIFLDGNVSIIGTTDDSFIFVINDPWHMKLSEKGTLLLSEENLKFISSINENTDYILFEVKLKSF